jgi:Domain of unknown function (DUF4062)
MTQPRYQIFVSSTFKDLQEERQAVLNAILKLNQFPAGMEIFPAVNDTAWEHIEKVIEDSDYYVLIIGGKYGSIEAESGISYTEKEYDFASSKNVPILAFIHSQPGKIEADKTEQNTKIRKKLETFKRKVGKHHCNYWSTVDELKAGVLASLSMSFVMNPQSGWIKADGINKNELLERLAILQHKYDDLLTENNKLKDSAILFDSTQFSFGDERIYIKFKLYSHDKEFIRVEVSWNDLFFGLSGSLFSKSVEYTVREILGQVMANYVIKNISRLKKEHFNSDSEEVKRLESRINEYKPKFQIENESFIAVRNQFVALDLVEISEIVRTYSGDFNKTLSKVDPTWQLTERGRKLYLSQKAFRREESVIPE